MTDEDDRVHPTYKELRDAERKKEGQCTYCRPNRGENAKRRPKYGRKRPPQHGHR